eukprot:3195606-Rhodomonas_salina.2
MKLSWSCKPEPAGQPSPFNHLEEMLSVEHFILPAYQVPKPWTLHLTVSVATKLSSISSSRNSFPMTAMAQANSFLCGQLRSEQMKHATKRDISLYRLAKHLDILVCADSQILEH